MSSLSVKLPITRSTADGFTMIKDFQTLVRQNFKMLVLTSPGERVMEPDFGVGVRSYLFENFNNSVFTEIESAIRKQVSIFLPVIDVRQIQFDSSNPDNNVLGIRIVYDLPDIGITDLLEFTI
jgi:phage baseplate assembly protein W